MCSHGWSEAEPVETSVRNIPAPKAGGGTTIAVLGSSPEITPRQSFGSRKPIAVMCFGALFLIIVIYFYYRGPSYPVVPAFDLREWSWPSGGSLLIKDANDGTPDLILMCVGVDSGLFDVHQLRSIPTRMLKNVPPLLRYIAEQNKVVEVPLESWDMSTGQMSASWTQPVRLYNRGTFTHDLITRLLQFNGKVVPTAGLTVLTAQPDPTKTYVAVLSAKGKLRKSWAFGDPTVRGDPYHQLFRMSDGTEVGKPVRLKVATNGTYVYPLWSADGRYVIYKELNELLWIIDVSAVLAAPKPE